MFRRILLIIYNQGVVPASTVSGRCVKLFQNHGNSYRMLEWIQWTLASKMKAKVHREAWKSIMATDQQLHSICVHFHQLITIWHLLHSYRRPCAASRWSLTIWTGARGTRCFTVSQWQRKTSVFPRSWGDCKWSMMVHGPMDEVITCTQHVGVSWVVEGKTSR